MIKRKTIAILMVTSLILANFLSNLAYARYDDGGSSSKGKAKQASIAWNFGKRVSEEIKTTVDQTGSATVTKSYKDELEIEKSGRIKIVTAVDDEGNLVDTSIKMTGDSDVFSNANSVQRREYVEPESKGVMNGVTQWECPSGTMRSNIVGQPNAKPQCYKEQDMSSGFYSVTDDGKINIYIDESTYGNPLFCTLATARGTSVSDFNSSLKECGEKLDKYESRDGEYQFGNVTISPIDEAKYTLNEKSLTNEAQGNSDYNADQGLTDTESEKDNDKCYANAGTLGWIMCPFIQTVSNFSTWLYESVIEPQLQIQAEGIFDTDTGVYNAWSAFRDLANLAFVILFLIVIISQITGYGIDNYGIKRMLPRIIIAAILINLSYFICQLAVDVANIVGISIKGFFSGLETQYNLVETTGPDAGQYTFLLASGAVVGVVAVLTSGLGGVITVALSALSLLISGIFLFAILVARQAGVVILVAISPLALVCYLLPNTENLSKKWLKVSEAILLLYPICSLVIAGGGLAGSIIASAAGDGSTTAGQGMYIAAMLVQVVPYFAIPSLVKNSMKGLGDLGARISSYGQRANKATVGRLRESDVVKDTKTRMSALDPGGLRSKMANSKLGIGRRRLANQTAAKLELQTKEARNKRLTSAEGREAIRSGMENRENEQAVSDYTNWYNKPENASDQLAEQLVELLGKSDQESLNRANAISDVLASRGELGMIGDATKIASLNGAFSKEARQSLSDNILSGKQGRYISSKDPILTEWAKANSLSDNEVSMHDIELSAITSLSANNLPDMKKQSIQRIERSINEAMNSEDEETRKKGLKALQHMQGISQSAMSGRVAERLDDEHRQLLNGFMGGENTQENAQPGESFQVQSTQPQPQIRPQPQPQPQPQPLGSQAAARVSNSDDRLANTLFPGSTRNPNTGLWSTKRETLDLKPRSNPNPPSNNNQQNGPSTT